MLGSLHTLEQYRYEIRHMAEALKSTGVDAGKKPRILRTPDQHPRKRQAISTI